MLDETPAAGPPATAWQPLTPQGVARFAHAQFKRLVVVQLVVAVGLALVCAWFATSRWFPVITQAIRKCPPGSAIRGGRLVWTGDSPALLAEGPFLAVILDREHTRTLGQTADFQMELGERGLRLNSLLGYTPVAYGPATAFTLEREILEPWWGAWKPMFLLALMALVVGFLFASWIGLALVYAGPVRLLAFFADRVVTFGGCWQLASAAALPGAMLMGASLVLYGWQRINLSGLIFAWLVHLVVGWLYTGGAIWCLPRGQRAKVDDNPFRSPAPPPPDAPDKQNS